MYGAALTSSSASLIAWASGSEFMFGTLFRAAVGATQRVRPAERFGQCWLFYASLFLAALLELAECPVHLGGMQFQPVGAKLGQSAD